MTQKIYENIEVLYETFKKEHKGTSKAAHGRARKILGSINKLITAYKKASVAEDKK
jgi:hypothetical protein